MTRVAPEAPVPLLNLSAMSRRAGGAGNVVENLSALGGHVIALGAVGPEEEGAWLARRLTTLPGARGTIVADPLRTTPVKRRMVSEGRQMLRVDQELAAGLSPGAERELTAAALRAVEDGRRPPPLRLRERDADAGAPLGAHRRGEAEGDPGPRRSEGARLRPLPRRHDA